MRVVVVSLDAPYPATRHQFQSLPTMLKKFIVQIAIPLADVLTLPFVYPSAVLLKAIRRVGVHRMPLAKQALLQIGVFPVRDHYYEPMFSPKHLNSDLSTERRLPGVDLNVAGQLEVLSSFIYADELRDLSSSRNGDLTYYLDNHSFEAGDAEYWYQWIRANKPSKIIEIGSGFSTLMARRAIKKNAESNPGYTCRHICIEPYEMPWLEQLGISVVRKRVEELDPSFFEQLQNSDILFIDSSHMIRPQGDVNFEFLEILPKLQQGVTVHVHDIFTPRDYPAQWVISEVRFWNEQYLLEAFLTSNSEWKVTGALNHLKNHHFEQMKDCCPFITQNSEPGSFYLKRI